jgi:hypothetical protein
MASPFGSTALGTINFPNISVPGAVGQDGANPVETDEERKRRLALQQQRNNPGVTALASLSNAGMVVGAGRYGGSLLSGFGL